VLRNRVDQVHLVAVPKQPFGMNPRSTTDVEDTERPFWEIPPDDLLGSQELELAKSTPKALILIELSSIMVEDLVGHTGITHGVEPTRLRK
jgi:hypothetical protein